MAARLGLLPRERDRLTPAEVQNLYEGMQWRRSRDIEVMTRAVWLIRHAHGAEDDENDLLARMPGYDGERKWLEDELREQKLKKMRQNAKNAKKGRRA